MSDVKESVHDLLIVLLCIAVLMVFVYFKQSREWNSALEARDQKIGELDQKLAGKQQEVEQAREAVAKHQASAVNAKNDTQAAMQLIGELESRNHKDEQEIADLKSMLKNRDSEIAQINTFLSTMKENTGKDIAASKARAIELENTLADQTRQLAEARAAVQRLEASEKDLQEKLQAADTAYSELSSNHQKLLDELAELKKGN